MILREGAGVPEDQLLQPLEEIVSALAHVALAQREGGDLVGAGRAADPEVDAAGVERLQEFEALRDHERRMVREHHAARADADALRHGRDLPDHDLGRGARDGGQVVVLGDPVARIAEAVGELREVERVPQRLARLRTGGHEGKIEDGEREHSARPPGGGVRPHHISSATRASSDMRLWSQGGSKTMLTFTSLTPGTAATAFSTQTGISPATGQPGAVSVMSTATFLSSSMSTR